MPPNCAVTVQEAVDLLLKYPDKFRSDPLPKWSSSIWEDLSKAIPGKWTALSWRNNVKSDRRKILTLTRQKMGVTDPSEPPINVCNDSTFIEHSDGEDDENKKTKKKDNDGTWFSEVKYQVKNGTWHNDVVLKPEEWIYIAPVSNIDGPRRSHTLKAHSWTGIIARKFLEANRGHQCAFSFKNAEINISERRRHYLKIRGQCPCYNQFFGFADEPKRGEGLTLRVYTRNTKDESDHPDVSRPLTGMLREEIGRQANYLGAAMVQNKQAQDYMKPGDKMNPLIPSLDVIRHAKKEVFDRDLGIEGSEKGEDVIQKIRKMKYENEFLTSFDATEDDPFKVIYGSSESIDIYQRYRKRTKNSSFISIDATGSVVKKLRRPNGTLSAHIFLYSIVVHGSGSICSVYNMLSEWQDTLTIRSWLDSWIRRIGINLKPKVACTDYSRALLSALSLSLNNVPLKVYMELCFLSINKIEITVNLPISTYLTIDVAHLIKIVCRWDCYKNFQHPRARDFFIRCITLMIDCQTLDDFALIFQLTYAVAFHQTLEATIMLNSLKIISIIDARRKLETLISERPRDANDYFKIFGSTEKSDPSAVDWVDGSIPPQELETSDSSFHIKKYIDDLVSTVTKVISEGSEPSAFCSREFSEKLVSLCYEFVLWTAVGLPFYFEHSSSSWSEKNFDSIKNEMLKNHKGPLQADKFIRAHLNYSTGSKRLFDGEMMKSENARYFDEERIPKEFLRRRKHSPDIQTDAAHSKTRHNPILLSPSKNPLEDSDLQSQENWRGKAQSTVIDSQSADLSDEEAIPHVSQKFEGINNNDDQSFISNSSATDNKSTVFESKQNSEDLKSHSPFIDHEVKPCSSKRDESTVPVNIFHSEDNSQNYSRTCEFNQNDKISSCVNKVYAKNIPSNGKFFTPFPEIAKLNEIREKPRKNLMLRNGHLCKVMNINNTRYFLQNTCAFDSITHIMAKGALDDSNYLSAILESDDKTLQFICYYQENGPSEETLKKRFEILKPLYENTMKKIVAPDLRDTVFSFDAEDYLDLAWEKIMNSEPSAFGQVECCTCGTYIHNYPYLTPNNWTICQHGFEVLEQALDFTSIIYNRNCRHCKGSTTEKVIMNNTVYIALNCQRTPDNAAKRCSLAEMPIELDFDKKLRLAGVIEFLPDSKHFIAYCRRISGAWELFNDLNMKVQSGIKNTRKITPHAAIYILNL